MTSPFKSKDFQVLKEYWDKKLKDSGFDDCESYNAKTGEPTLKEWHSSHFQLQHSPISFEAKEDYFREARAFLGSHKFKNQTHRHIWKLHTEGISLRDISAHLRKRHVILNKDSVALVIRKLQRLMRGVASPECESQILSQLELWSQVTKP